jgi:NAD-dependent deacetylase sirtuin 4
VFFGDSLPNIRAEQSLNLAGNASKVLVVGSSLAVWSAFRLVRAAKDRSGGGAQVAIVNVGPTRADDLADLKLELRAGDAMAGVAERLA